ncbi:MAG TPA: hypothetical protein DCG75_12885 [Bacteroidales bacterium]|jgi:hypothetical protein|nr:hypothetical protein [Bacteroidales bacterium]
MKTFKFAVIFTSVFVNYIIIANAQEENINTRFSENSMFLFNSFEEGVAYFNDEGISKSKFNYNVVYNDLCYINNTQILVITNVEELDSIKIGSKAFIWKNKKTYERVSSGKISVLLSRKAKLSSNKPSGAYGTESTTSAVSKKTSFYTGKGIWGGENCNLNNITDIEIPIIENFYLLINDEIVLATKSKINKYFKNHKDSIKEFINKNSINLKDKNDLIVFTKFLETLYN